MGGGGGGGGLCLAYDVSKIWKAPYDMEHPAPEVINASGKYTFKVYRYNSSESVSTFYHLFLSEGQFLKEELVPP